MRTGRSWSTATLQMVENCSSRRRPVPTLPGLIERARAVGELRQQQVAVVVEIADERRRAPRVEHALLDLRHRGRRVGHVDGDADHVRARFRQFDALLRRATGVRRVGHRHRLHDDRRAAAHLHARDAVRAADSYADRFVELDEGHGSDGP
jgi:hypothetical protein